MVHGTIIKVKKKQKSKSSPVMQFLYETQLFNTIYISNTATNSLLSSL